MVGHSCVISQAIIEPYSSSRCYWQLLCVTARALIDSFIFTASIALQRNRYVNSLLTLIVVSY
jgi:hypothetical protein